MSWVSFQGFGCPFGVLITFWPLCPLENLNLLISKKKFSRFPSVNRRKTYQVVEVDGGGAHGGPVRQNFAALESGLHSAVH